MVEVAVKHAKLVNTADEGKLLQQQLQLRSTARDTAQQKGRGRKGKGNGKGPDSIPKEVAVELELI